MEDQSDPEPGNGCVHHWLIDPPKGEASSAVCKYCGQRRDFLNSPETRFLKAKDAQVRTAKGTITSS